MRITALAICFCLFATGTAQAEIQMRTPPVSPDMGGQLDPVATPDLILAHKVSLIVRSNEPASSLRRRMLGMLHTADIDGVPGYSEADIRALADQKVAESRARLMGTILRYDLNGDLTVTRDEVSKVAATEAGQPIRRGNTEVLPTEDQIEQAVNQTVAQVMVNDLDGDFRITPAEVDALAERQRGGIVKSKTFSNRTLPWDFDIDGNGRITRLETERAARIGIGYIDVNRDGILTRDEISTARNTLRRSINQRDLGTQQRAGGKCQLPPAPAAAQRVVLYAQTAGALSNLQMEREGTKPVGYVELAVPEGKREIWVYAAFSEPVVIGIVGSDAARARVRTITAMNRPVVVADAPDAQVIEARCVFGFLGITSGSETIEQRYASAIGGDVRLFSGNHVGGVDLATGTVAAGPLADDDTPQAPASGPLAALFQRFRPNGFRIVPPETVRGYRAVAPAPVWPEEAGLLEHVRTGAMVVLNSDTATVAKRAHRRTELAGKLESRSRGSDRVQNGDTIFWRQPDGSWLGYEKVVLGVTRPIDMPHGLQNRRIRIILDKGVPKPRGGALSPILRN